MESSLNSSPNKDMTKVNQCKKHADEFERALILINIAVGEMIRLNQL